VTGGGFHDRQIVSLRNVPNSRSDILAHVYDFLHIYVDYWSDFTVHVVVYIVTNCWWWKLMCLCHIFYHKSL